MYEKEENYLALAVSVLANCPPENAFVLLTTGKRNIRAPRKELTDLDVEDMVKLKTEMSWADIGATYGMSAAAAFRRVDRYLKKKAG